MVKQIQYFELLKKSWGQFRQNLVLITPILLAIILSLGMFVLVALEALIVTLPVGLFDFQSFMNSIQLIVLASLFVILDIIIVFVIGAKIRSMMIGGFYDVAKKGSTSYASMKVYARKLWKKVLGVSIIQMAIILVPLLVLGGIASLFLLASQEAFMVAAMSLGIIYGIYFIVAAVILYFGLFFITPKIVTENKRPIDLMKSSLQYTKENLTHVLITWAVMLLAVFCFAVIQTVASMPLAIVNMMASISGATGAIIGIAVARMVIGFVFGILRMILQLTLQVFIFNSYFAKK